MPEPEPPGQGEQRTPTSRARSSPRRRRRRRRKSQDSAAWRRFRPALGMWLALLALNGVIGVAGHFTDVESPPADVLTSVVFALLVALFLWPSRSDLRPLLTSPGFEERTWWATPAVVLVMTPLLLAYFGALEWMGIESAQLTWRMLLAEWPFIAALLLFCVVPAVCEELAFRGFLFGRLCEFMGTRDALIVQAAMFSVLHMSPLIFLSHFAMGLSMGWLRARTGSLWPSILLHMAWNAYVVGVEWVELGPRAQDILDIGAI